MSRLIRFWRWCKVRNSPTRSLVLGAFILTSTWLVADLSTAQPTDPVYVGVRACSECHEGPETAHQFSVWRLSAHAKAFATLSLPISEEIARISGIPEPPHRARVCLGCHATGADAEEWERAEGFLIQDGIQCETCHGPGSEYMDEEVMRDRELAMKRGLRFPTATTCMTCHNPKGSHEAVLPGKPYVVEEALERIAHARPADPVVPSTGGPAETPNGESEHSFTGVMVCAECHAGPERGFQFSKWLMGPHARA